MLFLVLSCEDAGRRTIGQPNIIPGDLLSLVCAAVQGRESMLINDRYLVGCDTYDRTILLVQIHDVVVPTSSPKMPTSPQTSKTCKPRTWYTCKRMTGYAVKDTAEP